MHFWGRSGFVQRFCEFCREVNVKFSVRYGLKWKSSSRAFEIGSGDLRWISRTDVNCFWIRCLQVGPIHKNHQSSMIHIILLDWLLLYAQDFVNCTCNSTHLFSLRTATLGGEQEKEARSFVLDWVENQFQRGACLDGYDKIWCDWMRNKGTSFLSFPEDGHSYFGI